MEFHWLLLPVFGLICILKGSTASSGNWYVRASVWISHLYFISTYSSASDGMSWLSISEKQGRLKGSFTAGLGSISIGVGWIGGISESSTILHNVHWLFKVVITDFLYQKYRHYQNIC